jgi:hypothetical protein
MKRLLSILLLCVLGSAGKSFALPPCPASGVFDDCVGAWTFAEGQTYFGEWKNDKRHGQGVFKTPEGLTYVGEWKDDNMHGQGSATFPSGQTYVGGWKDSKRHGQGSGTWSDGETYVGEWKDSKRHGQGSATWSDGEKYAGEFKDDKRHGQGSLISPDGETYVGAFKDNEPHHEGVVKTDAASDKDDKQLDEKVGLGYGYKNLKIGMTINDLNQLQVCDREISQFKGHEAFQVSHVSRRLYHGYQCYDEKSWSFNFSFPGAEFQTTEYGGSLVAATENSRLEILEIITGVYVQESHDHLRGLLGDRYKVEYGFTDTDLERYNKFELDTLYVIYQGGEVALGIARVCDGDAQCLPSVIDQDYTVIEYRNKLHAKKFLETAIPKKLKSDDF